MSATGVLVLVVLRVQLGGRQVAATIWLMRIVPTPMACIGGTYGKHSADVRKLAVRAGRGHWRNRRRQQARSVGGCGIPACLNPGRRLNLAVSDERTLKCAVASAVRHLRRKFFFSSV